MNVAQMVQKNPTRSCSPPKSLFRAKTPQGEIKLCCFGSIVFDCHLKEPMDYLSWEVVDEFISPEEYHKIVDNI